MASPNDPLRGAVDAFDIVPNDVTALPSMPNAILFKTAGNITFRAANSAADVTLVAMPAGYVLPVQARFVRATGTTATLLGLA